MSRLFRSLTPLVPVPARASALVWCGALVACAEAHAPQAGDSNTSWLKACAVESDCGNAARCINHLCTLPCAEDEASICQRISPSASCMASAGACDVLCTSNSECQGLGSDFSCEANSCRRQTVLDVSTQTLRVYPPRETLSRDFRLGQLDAIWAENHWRVVTQATLLASAEPPEGYEPRVTALAVADVYPDARLEHHLVTNENLQVTTTKGVVVAEDSSIFEWVGGARDVSMTNVFPETCQVRFYGPNPVTDVHTLTVSCSDELNGLGVDANGDWLIQRERGSAVEAELSLGRYRVRERRWVVEPQVITRVDEQMLALSLQIHDEHIRLYWHRPSATSLLASLPVMGELRPNMLPIEAWQPLDLALLRVPIEGEGFIWTHYSDGWLVPDALSGRGDSWGREDEQGRYHALAVPVDGAAGPLEPVTFELGLAPPTFLPPALTVQALRAIPGRDLVALCYSDSVIVVDEDDRRTLKLALFDRAGALRAGPWQLASSSLSLQSCRLSWSGRAFLATWIEDWNGEQAASFARIIEPKAD